MGNYCYYDVFLRQTSHRGALRTPFGNGNGIRDFFDTFNNLKMYCFKKLFCDLYFFFQVTLSRCHQLKTNAKGKLCVE